MATPRFHGGLNGFMPQATGQVIAFARDKSEFAINRYVQMINSPAPLGIYFKLDPDQAVRVVNEAEFAWEDGDPRPTGHANLSSFSAEEFRCFRRDYPFSLGMQAVETSRKFGSVDPVVVESKNVTSQAMTNRTNRVIQLMQTASNWPATNTATANVINGGHGYWDNASSDPTDPGYLAIKRSILGAARRINLLTNGKVRLKDLRLVLSPGAAEKMAETSEIHDYLAKSRYAGPVLTGQSQGGVPEIVNYNEIWGLPPNLYGVEVVVEDSPIVTIYPKASGVAASVTTGERAYCKSDDSAVLVTRPAGIDGAYGTQSFSTVQCYFYKYELAVQTFEDTKNELVEGHVVEQFKEILAAAAAGYLIQDIMS